MGPCAQEHTAALPGSRTGSARFNVLLNPRVAAALNTPLSASAELQLKAQLNARFSAAVSLPLSA